MFDVLVSFRLLKSVRARLERLVPQLNADPEYAVVARITLQPDSTDGAFRPIVLEALEEGELTIVAELLEVLR